MYIFTVYFLDENDTKAAFLRFKNEFQAENCVKSMRKVGIKVWYEIEVI